MKEYGTRKSTLLAFVLVNEALLHESSLIPAEPSPPYLFQQMGDSLDVMIRLGDLADSV